MVQAAPESNDFGGHRKRPVSIASSARIWKQLFAGFLALNRSGRKALHGGTEGWGAKWTSGTKYISPRRRLWGRWEWLSDDLLAFSSTDN
jgi:hypothetical protein